MNWGNEILNYFESKLTNARTEGYNNVAKQVQKMAYGYKNFGNYRLKNPNHQNPLGCHHSPQKPSKSEGTQL